MRILSISTKGGSGKSTLVYEILAPYLYTRFKKKPIVLEFDAENQESLNYKNAQIFEARNFPYTNAEAIAEKLNAMSRDENYLIDVGGGARADAFLRENAAFLSMWFDYIFVPMMAGAQDAVNAAAVWEDIVARGYAKEKIVFAGSEAVYTFEEENIAAFVSFFGSPHFPRKDGGYGFSGRKPEDSPADNFVFVPLCPQLQWSKLQGKTAWEAGQGGEKYLKMLEDSLLDYENKVHAQMCYRQILKLSEWATGSLEGQCFLKLDRLLGGSK